MLDQVLRYAPVLEAIHQAPGETLLEVGSGSHGIAAYLSGSWALTACDTSFEDYGAHRVGTGEGVTRITGSVLALPFPDASFDVVIALDLLEHLAPTDRTAAVVELRRVAATTLVVGCPCGSAAEDADRRLALVYDRLGRPRPGWLEEHLRYGLPDEKLLLSAARATDHTEVIANTAVRSQAWLMACQALPLLWRCPTIAGKAARWLLRRAPPGAGLTSQSLRLLRGRDKEPAYRRIAVVTMIGS